jgi:predicted hydrocarbon binding protein
MVPGGLGRSFGASAAVRAAKKVLGAELSMEEGGAVGQMTKPLSILALPEGQACTFYGSALAEVLRLLTGFEGAMAHERCRSRGDDRCTWRATAVGGYD